MRLKPGPVIGLLSGLVVVLLMLLLRAQATIRKSEGARPAAPGQELARNGGFEEAGTPAGGWSPSEKGSDKGRASRDEGRFHAGTASMKLEPNVRNGGEQPLSVMQVISGPDYRGRQVAFSGYLAAEGGATAVLGMLSLAGGRPGNLAVVTQPAGASDWVRHDRSYEVPDDPSVRLVLFCSVSGQSGAAWFDDVSVVAVPR
jgi:hypothetical protein